MEIIPSVWGSIIVMVRQIIEQATADGDEGNLDFIDWDAHANMDELPERDLIGPIAFNLAEEQEQQWTINFALAASTWSTDRNLFRHRKILNIIYERMRPNRTMLVYDSQNVQKVTTAVFTGGTVLVPMTRTESRPFQYVQNSLLLVPSSKFA